MYCRHRIHGSDTPFSDWLRRQEKLPASSNEIGFVATDNDLTLHVYKEPVDEIGTREIQSMMHVEVKTRGGMPTSSQKDTLWKLHHHFMRKGNNGKPGQMVFNQSILIRHFGVSIVVLSGESPEDSETIQWLRFNRNPRKRNDVWIIDKTRLIELLRFDVHPDNFDKKPFRRHHKTREIIVDELTPLGFVIQKRVLQRS